MCVCVFVWRVCVCGMCVYGVYDYMCVMCSVVCVCVVCGCDVSCVCVCGVYV